MVTQPRADVAWREPRCGWFGPRRGPWRSGPAAAAAYLAREQEAGRWWWRWQCLGGGWGHQEPSEPVPWWLFLCMFFRWFQQWWPASLRVKIDYLWPRRSVWACCAATSTAGRKYWANMAQLGRKRLIRALLGCVMLGATLVNVSVLFMWVIVTFMGMTTCLKFIEICWKSFLCCLFPLHSGGAGAEWLWCTSYASYAS